MTASGANRIAEYLRFNPDATAAEVLGATGADPSTWDDILKDALASDEPHLALETPDTAAPEGDSRDENPTLEADKPASTTSYTPDSGSSTTELNQQSRGDDRDVLVNPALADALEWFHQQLDRELPEDADHDTPRDYYRDGRGWDADTIDEKLLGYAPANYRDELLDISAPEGEDGVGVTHGIAEIDEQLCENILSMKRDYLEAYPALLEEWAGDMGRDAEDVDADLDGRDQNFADGLADAVELP